MQFRKILPLATVSVVALTFGLVAGTVGGGYFSGRSSSGYDSSVGNQGSNGSNKSEPYSQAIPCIPSENLTDLTKNVPSPQVTPAAEQVHNDLIIPNEALSSYSYAAPVTEQTPVTIPKETFDIGKYLDKLSVSASYTTMTAGDFNAKFSQSVRKDATVHFIRDIGSPYTAVYVDSPDINDSIIVWGKNGINRSFSTAETEVDRDITRIDQPTTTKFLDITVDGDTVIYAIERDGKIIGSDENIGVISDGITPLHSVQVWAYYPEKDKKEGVGSYDVTNFDSSVWIGNLDTDHATEIVISTSIPVRTFTAKYNDISGRGKRFTAGGPSGYKSVLQILEIGSSGLTGDYALSDNVNTQLKDLRSASSDNEVKKIMEENTLGTSAVTTMVLAGADMQKAINTEALQHIEELGANARAEIYKAAFQALMGDSKAVLSLIDAFKYRDLADVTISNAGFYSLGNSTQPFNGTTGSAFDPSTPTYRVGATDLPKSLIPDDIKKGLDNKVLTVEQSDRLNAITSKYNANKSSSDSNSTSSSNGSTGFDYNVPHGNYDPATDPRAAQNAQDRANIDKALNDFNNTANGVTKGLNETANSASNFLSGLLNGNKK